MKKNRTHRTLRTRLRDLRQNRTPGITAIESIRLRLAGRRDGKNGLPKADPTAALTSPFLAQEGRSFTEYAAAVWARVELETEADYLELGNLVQQIRQGNAEIAALSAEIGHLRAEADLTARRYGEEALPTEIVCDRRKRETEARLRFQKEKLEGLIKQRSAALEKLTAIYNRLLQREVSAQLICTHTLEHTRQRISCYYRAAFHHHPDNKNLPPELTTATPVPEGESTYRTLHAPVHAAAEALLEESRSEERI